MANNDYDSIVIGGGPAGLSAAMMLGRALRRVLILDDSTGRNRFSSHMHGVLGFDGVGPQELLRRGQHELAAYDITFTSEQVSSVADDTKERLRVVTDRGDYTGRSVIDASGVVDRPSPIAGLAELWGRRVLHCPYCHGWEVRGQRLAVIATPQMGLFQANLLRQWSETLTVFTAAVEPIADTDRIALDVRGTLVNKLAVTGVQERSDGALDVYTVDGETTTVDAIFTGSTLMSRADHLPVAVSLNPEGFPRTDETGQTTHPRIWMAGNAAVPYGNIPMSMGSGSAVGGAVNAALVQEDMDRANAAPRAGEAAQLSCNYP